MGRRAIDITGQTFGAWTVVQRMPLRKGLVKKNAEWLCRCACGTERVLQGAALRSGLTDRCRECANKGLQTHGLSTSPVYNIWTGIKQRTGNPSCSVWHLYGGRGITMAAEWRDSFERFAAGHGASPFPSVLSGPNRQRWSVRPRELPLGHQDGAVPQQPS